MNERIKQLANIWANRRAEDEKLGIVYTFSEPALEQFAHVIVQECVAICQDTDGEEDDMAKCGRQDCAVEIREHFGIDPKEITEAMLDRTIAWCEQQRADKKHFGVEEK